MTKRDNHQFRQGKWNTQSTDPGQCAAETVLNGGEIAPSNSATPRQGSQPKLAKKNELKNRFPKPHSEGGAIPRELLDQDAPRGDEETPRELASLCEDASVRLEVKRRDQRLTQAALEGDQEAMSTIIKTYEFRLLKLAEKRWENDPFLKGAYEPKDLVQDFLLKKVIRKKETMFKQVASGERPLWPKLSHSLANHLNTLRRKVKNAFNALQIPENFDAPDKVVSGDKIHDNELLQSRWTVAQAAIRITFGARRLDEAVLLLLSERVGLANKITDTFRAEPGSLEISFAELAEKLTPWNNLEQSQALFTNSLTLQNTWLTVCPLFEQRPKKVTGNDIAQILNISRPNWDKSVQLAREAVAKRFRDDPDVRWAFANWPEGVWDRT